MGIIVRSDQKTLSVEAALRERVKELTCLYGIAQIAGKPNIMLEELLGICIAKLHGILDRTIERFSVLVT